MMAEGFSYFDYLRITEDVPELYALMQKWKAKVEEYRKEWGDGLWPAKCVQTSFVYQGKPYHYFPDDLGLERGDCWDEGLMEYMQGDIAKDLKALGATDVCDLGFLD